MIYFSDATINETNGDYQAVCELMKKDNAPLIWMINTKTTVSEGGVVSNYNLNFWHDGKIVMYHTDRHPSLNIPDDDVRSLSDWSKKNGWTKIELNNHLIADPIGFEFWLHMYRAGLVYSEELEKHDQSEFNSFSVS